MIERHGASASLTEVDLCALGASTELPYDIERYFCEGPGAVLLPLNSLIVTRARPAGIANASQLMRAAYEGRHPRRNPITVRLHAGSDFLVEDGNSTVLNAIASAWPNILCVTQ